jgi:hypothetical protein
MTILFKSDWKNAEGRARAMPHHTTTNKSFMRTCQLFKRMGIQNYAFPLALYDPDLLHVDVHALDENTPENEILRQKVLIEASKNGWYFLRECVRIYEQGGSPISFRLDRGSAAMAWCFFNGIDYTGMQPRQTGKTVCALSVMSWVLYISGFEFQMGMMAKDNNLREENVKRVKSFGENLPSWWIAEDKNADKSNTTEILYAALRTHYKTFVAQKDKGTADLQARGASPPVFHFDEFEFCVNIAISYPTILASTGTARENAKKNGKPYSNIITTTAGDPMKQECKEAAKILEGAMPFTELLYDIENNVKLHEIVKAASPQKMIIGVFSHLQLGYDNNWLREKITRNRMSRDNVMRDYLNRRVSIQDKPIIAEHVLNAITASEREPSDIQILGEKFVVYWYVSKEVRESAAFKERSIVVGCDSSEMIDRDATTLIGIDPSSLDTVLSFRCSEGNINVVGAMIAQLLLMYPKMILVPENKSSGTAIIDNVSLILRKYNQNPFLRMYNQVVDNRHEEEFASIDIRDVSLMDTKIKRFFGVKTDKGKRDQLFTSTLMEGTSRAMSRIKDHNLIEELGSLTNRNGRVDHAVGGHDDTVIAWLMAMWFILSGKHHSIYGIKPGTVLSRNSEDKPDKNKLTEQHHAMVLKKIEDLEKFLKQQPDPVMRKYIEGDIIVLRAMVVDAPILTPTTADELISDPKRFTDPSTVHTLRPQADADDVERSLKALFNLSH